MSVGFGLSQHWADTTQTT